MSSQLTLLPTTAPEVRRESLPLELIDGCDGACPTAKLRKLIGQLGLLQPIVVATAGSGRYRVIEGRRRCKAIAQLAEAGDWPRPARVDALVVEGRQSARREVCGGLTLALHASRTASPASELQAVESILQTSESTEEAVTVKEIAAQTGMSVQSVRRRLRLRSLTARLRTAFDEGRITAGIAETAARLSEEQQTGLERQLEEEGRLTLADVRELAHEQTTAATAALPEQLFGDHDLAWQTTVRGHLTAGLGAVLGEGHSALRQRIAEVIAALDEDGP